MTPGLGRYALLGASIGSLIGGSAGYFLTPKEKGRKRRIRNAILTGLSSGALGGFAGSAYKLDQAYRRMALLADNFRAPGGKEIPHMPGRIWYLTFNRNKLNKDDLIPIQHSAILTNVKSDDPRLHDYFFLRSYTNDPRDNKFDTVGKSNPAKGQFEEYQFKIENSDKMSPKELMKAVIEKTKEHFDREGSEIWGNSVTAHYTDVDDVIRADKMFYATRQDKDREDYGVLPGSMNCGTFSRALFDYTRKSRLGHILDLLIGGFPSQNAPSIGTKRVDYTIGE